MLSGRPFPFWLDAGLCFLFNVFRDRIVQLGSVLALLAGLAIVVTGWFRVQLDVDVLDVLPSDLPEVVGLKAYREHFANERELLVVVEAQVAAGDADRPEAAGEDGQDVAGHLAEWLRRDLEPSPEVRWRDFWQSRSEEGADLLAWLLLNAGEQEFRELQERITGDAANQVMERSLETLALTMDPGEVERVRHDPLGLTDSLLGMMEDRSLGDVTRTREGKGSPRILFVECPPEFQGYKEVADWVGQVRDSCQRWRESEGDALGVSRLGLTGEPAFVSEVAIGMEHDMRGTAGMTALAVAVLFWLFHRRLRPLLWLAAMMVLVLGATLGLGAWLFGAFSVMSVGFASILIGLVVDYGVVIFSDARAEPGSREEIRKRVAGSILWASATTAAVFAVMGFSSLPGVAQLGRLVALGIVLGAVVMLALYLPLCARLTAGRRPAQSRMTGRLGVMDPEVMSGRSRCWRTLLQWWIWLPLVVWLGAVGVLWQRGLPAFDHGFEVLRPAESPAMETFEWVFGMDGESDPDRSLAVPVVVLGDDYGGVDQAMGAAAQEAARLEADGLIDEWMFPENLWPQVERMEERLEAADEWWRELPRLERVADEVGFEPEALGLLEATLTKWRDWGAGQGLRSAIEQVEGNDLISRVVDLSADAPAALGTLTVPGSANLDQVGERMRMAGAEVWPAAWEAVAPAVEPLVWHDLLWVFLPMIGVLLALLSLVFRSWRDVVLTLLAMGLAMTVLLAWMALAGWRWNFLVITALPLLVGAGLDYSIHLLLAVKRHEGDLRRVWLGVGRALVFCGSSTAIGFGSLALASNRGLMGLGLVCATGLLLMMTSAVVLLPRWAVWLGSRSR